jgi:hypothetical protein
MGRSEWKAGQAPLTSWPRLLSAMSVHMPYGYAPYVHGSFCAAGCSVGMVGAAAARTEAAAKRTGKTAATTTNPVSQPVQRVYVYVAITSSMHIPAAGIIDFVARQRLTSAFLRRVCCASVSRFAAETGTLTAFRTALGTPKRMQAILVKVDTAFRTSVEPIGLVRGAWKTCLSVAGWECGVCGTQDCATANRWGTTAEGGTAVVRWIVYVAGVWL